MPMLFILVVYIYMIFDSWSCIFVGYKSEINLCSTRPTELKPSRTIRAN